MPATPGQAEVTFVLSVDALMAKSASVRVRVVDGNGAPVVGANVALNDAQTGGWDTKSDADGRVVLSYLKAGRLDFKVWHKDLRAPPVRIDVHAGADLDLGDITLRPAVQVELDFDNFGGKGGVRAYWLDAPPRAGWHTDEIHLIAENRGSRKLSLFPGRYGLLATTPNGVAFVEIDANTPSSEPIHFDLQPGAPLRIEHRSDTGSVQLTMRDRKGLVVYQRELRGTGEFTVKLPPGEYEAESGDGSTPRTRRAITLGRDGTTLKIP
jgi:hypothetical protein